MQLPVSNVPSELGLRKGFQYINILIPASQKQLQTWPGRLNSN